ncbi:hypothetical protein D9M70_427850 [compost metagenome]
MHHHRASGAQVHLLVVPSLAVVGGQLGLGGIPAEADAAGVATVLAVAGLGGVVGRVALVQVAGDARLHAGIAMLGGDGVGVDAVRAAAAAQGNADGGGELGIRLAERTGLLVARHRQAVGGVLEAAAVTELQAAAAARAVPVGGFADGEVDRAAAEQGLVHRQVDAALLPAEAHAVEVVLVRHAFDVLAEGAVALGGVAVADHGEAGFRGVDGLGIEDAVALALLLALPPGVGLAIGDVGREATIGRVEAEAGVGRGIFVGREQAAITGDVVGHAVDGRALHQFGRGLVVVVVFAGGDAVAQAALAGHHRQVGVGLPEGPLAAVRLDDLHLQVAVGTAGVDVGDLEGARRHAGGVDDEAVLAHFHCGVGFGDAAHYRCIADFVVGQHADVGLQLRTAHTHAVEDVALGVGVQLAHRQRALEAADVPFDVGAVAGELVALAGAAAQGRVVAQAPAEQVEAVAQTDVAVVAGLPVVGIAADVGLVVGEQRGDAIVPQ